MGPRISASRCALFKAEKAEAAMGRHDDAKFAVDFAGQSVPMGQMRSLNANAAL
jgi:hypothetical protein